MNEIQKKAISLIKDDLRFLYTILKNQDVVTASYYMALMPYMGVIIDGIEDWIKSYNNSNNDKLNIPTFNEQEQAYYEAMRNSVKIFNNGIDEAYEKLKENYIKSKEYFSSVCKPLARVLHLYDIYGIYRMNGIYCDNTILDSYYLPIDDCFGDNGKFISNMSEIGGAYISCFDAMNTYQVKKDSIFFCSDYGGFVKSPVGNKYGYKFLLLSIYCQINFIMKCIDEFIIEETSTKLRFAYILYYYLLKVLPDINKKYKCEFKMSNKYHSDVFRNTMAHYKLGVLLKEEEIVDDIMFGMTQKCFEADYMQVKKFVINELKDLSMQIKTKLKLK